MRYQQLQTQVSLGIVMLSAAKHLVADRERPFAALRVTPKGNTGAMRELGSTVKLELSC
jgi:hypothetical protein